MRVACIVLESKTQLKPFAEACLRLSPQVALGESWVFIEIAACKHLYTEDSCRLRLQALSKRFQISTRIAIADDLPTALAMAFTGRTHRQQLPIESLSAYASPFELSPLLEKPIHTLKQLGIDTIGAIQTLSPRALTPRFGKTLAIALHHLERAPHLPWPRFHPPLRMSESTEISEDHRVTDLEPVLFLLKRLVDTLVMRLRGRWLLASTIELRLSTEKYSVVQRSQRSWQLNLAFPQGGTLGILSLLKERLETALQKEPLQSPLCYLEIEITETVISPARQKDFFSKKEEELEATQTAIARLVDRLGMENVFLASPQESYLPEKSWSKTLETFAKDPDLFRPVAERPLRVLKSPVPLRQIDNHFVCHNKRWRILESVGPERISGEWWHKDQERDYFHIKTDSDELWVYKLPATQSYFLHGLFD